MSLDSTSLSTTNTVSNQASPRMLDSSARMTASAEAAHSKPSILFIVDQLTELGGGERVLLHLAREVTSSDMRALVVTFRTKVDPAASRSGQEIVLLPMSSCFSLKSISVAYKLWKLIRRERVAVVHTFFETSDLFGAAVARLAGVKLIISSRRDMGILRNWRHQRAYRIVAPLFTSILAVSDRVREWHMSADGLRDGQIRTIHNGISLDRFDRQVNSSALRSKLNLSPHTRLVTTIANINAWKGLDTFLAAAALISVEHSGTEFCIAGDWTDMDVVVQLQQQAKNLGIDSIVHLLGRVEDVAGLLKCSDVFALLSQSEGFPNVVLEAMAARVAVVATAVGGTPEAITDGADGFLVQYGDAEGAAAKISELLSDKALSSRFTTAARERVEKDFSVEQMARKHLDLYRSLLVANT
jgi:L-malate glycosyltransferase